MAEELTEPNGAETDDQIEGKAETDRDSEDATATQAEAPLEPAVVEQQPANDDPPVVEQAEAADAGEDVAGAAEDVAAEADAGEDVAGAAEDVAAEEEDAPQVAAVLINLPDDGPISDEQLEQAYNATFENIKEGETVRGRVLHVGSEGVLVDIGYKSEGLIPISEFIVDGDGPDVHAEDEIDVYLVRLEDADGQVVLSKEIADQRRVWEKIAEAYDAGQAVTGTPTRRIKGGLRVEIGNMFAFLPASQIDIRPVQDLDSHIGRPIEMRVIKLNRRRRNIVLSRRVLLEEQRESMRHDLLETLAAGQVRKGVVKNITQFGAFIDLGGLDGLLHKTDMSWGRVGHPSEAVERDQELEVMVLNINREAGKVSLGLKQLTKDPWEGIGDRFPIGSDAPGRVVNIVEYGAFVELEEGVEGLVHVSEMSWTRRNVDAHTVLQVGEEITVRILNVDPDRQKISLGLKQLQENPWDRLERDKPVGSRVVGKVRNITDFGVFVEIEEGIDGLVHVSDLSWTKRVDPGDIMHEGDEVEVVILDIDRRRERVSLGLKQLDPDPWLDVPEKYKVGTTVSAEIVNLTNFGAFAKLEEGIEGLIHISELSDAHVEDPAEVVSVGDALEVKVIHLDLQDRRIGLSRKAYVLEQERVTNVSPEPRQPREPREPRQTATVRPPKRRGQREQNSGASDEDRATLGDLIDMARQERTEDLAEASTAESDSESTEAPAAESDSESTDGPATEPDSESTDAPATESDSESTDAPATESDSESTDADDDSTEASAEPDAVDDGDGKDEPPSA
jgi:small subunit ribosomal protein S1